MVTAGIDMGMENVKALVLRDGEIIGRGKGRSGGAARNAAAESALAEALREASLSAVALNGIVATGKGKFDALFAGRQVTEAVALAKAAKFLLPESTCVMSAGADETLVLTFDPKGKIRETVLNEKCAAGIGGFLRRMAMLLELTPEEMSGLPPVAPGGPAVNDGCVVFAELDVFSLLNRGVTPQEIASAVTDAAAIRACTVINDITIPALDCAALFGGLTNNKAFVRALKDRSGVDFIIPEEAEYAGALGAALIAAAGVKPS